MSELILKPSHTGDGFDLIFTNYKEETDSIWFADEEKARQHVDYMNRDKMVEFTIKVEK